MTAQIARLHMVDRTRKEFSEKDISKLATTYQAWRTESAVDTYNNVAGYCKSVTLEEIRKHNHILTPGHFVGTEVVQDLGEPCNEVMRRLVARLQKQQNDAKKLDATIRANLKELEYGA